MSECPAVYYTASDLPRSATSSEQGRRPSVAMKITGRKTESVCRRYAIGE